ncbi:hypothetical protein ACFOWE_21695 [Planomonospora corallina]|uniref:Lipoprotein n=1 Tax=Planomonospora corallina TaxID=1806052 RepID=A0ABV8ICZ9_9ACTN
MRRRCASYGLVTTWAVVTGLLTGCQSAPAGSAPAPGGTAPPSAAPAGPRATAEEAVLASYRGMWREFVSAAESADWRAPGLGEYAAGDALIILRHGLWRADRKGRIIRGEPVLSPQVTALRPVAAPARAKIVDCVDDTAFTVRTRSGRPVTRGAPAGRHRATAGLALHDGAWYVRSLVLREAGTC